MSEPCPTCGRRTPGNKGGKMQLKKELTKKLRTLMAWGDSDFKIQNKSLLQSQMQELIERILKSNAK